MRRRVLSAPFGAVLTLLAILVILVDPASAAPINSETGPAPVFEATPAADVPDTEGPSVDVVPTSVESSIPPEVEAAIEAPAASSIERRVAIVAENDAAFVVPSALGDVTQVQAGQNSQDPIVGPQGNIWFGNRDFLGAIPQDIARISGDFSGTPTVDLFATGAPGLGVPNPVDPFVDPVGNIWFGNADGGGSGDVVRVSGDLSGTPTIDEFTGSVPNPDSGIVGPIGNLWFGSGRSVGAGADQILRIGGDLSGAPSLIPFTTPMRNPTTPIVGPAGNIWFGNGDVGGSDVLLRVGGDLSGIPTITPFPTGIPSPQTPVIGPLGNIWFGNLDQVTDTATQVIRVSVSADGSPTITPFATGVALPRDPVVGPDGNIWFGSNTIAGGTLVIRVGGDLSGMPTMTPFDSGVPSPATPIVGPDGNIWFGSLGFEESTLVARISGDLSSTTPTITTFDTAVADPATAVIGPQGNLWFGTFLPPFGSPTSDVIRVDAADANVTIVKTCIAPVHCASVSPGSALTFALAVSNLGPSDAGHIVLTDNLPTGLAVTDVNAPAGWTCVVTSDAPSVNCTKLRLQAGKTSTVEISVLVDRSISSGTFTNTASVAWAAPNSDPSVPTTSSVTVEVVAVPKSVEPLELAILPFTGGDKLVPIALAMLLIAAGLVTLVFSRAHTNTRYS